MLADALGSAQPEDSSSEPFISFLVDLCGSDIADSSKSALSTGSGDGTASEKVLLPGAGLRDCNGHNAREATVQCPTASALGVTGHGAMPTLRASAYGVSLHLVTTQYDGPFRAQPSTGMPAFGGHSMPSFAGATASCTPSEAPGCTDASGSRRVRKRGLPDLQQELKTLTARFEQLTRVNGFLRCKLKALERMLPHKDQHVGFLVSARSTDLQGGGSSGGGSADGPGLAVADGIKNALPCTVTSTSPAPAADPSLAASPGPGIDLSLGYTHGLNHNQNQNHSHSHGASLLPREVQVACREAAPPSAAGGAACGEWSTAQPWQMLQLQAGPRALQPHGGMGAPGVPAALALCPGPDGPVPEITPEAMELLRRVTPQEFRMLWKHMCLQTGLLVASAEALGPGSPQYARMERFLERVVAYITKVCLLSPACYLQSIYVNLETGRRERPGDDFWAAIGAAIRFTPAQLQEVDSLCTLHEQNVAPVLRERSALVHQLCSLMAVVTSPQRACTSNVLVEAHNAVEDLVGRLQRNAFREVQAHGDTGGFLCWSVLTPLQLGKSFAASYPYMPDGLAIMHGVRASHRQAPEALPAHGAGQ